MQSTIEQLEAWAGIDGLNVTINKGYSFQPEAERWKVSLAQDNSDLEFRITKQASSLSRAVREAEKQRVIMSGAMYTATKALPAPRLDDEIPF